MPRPTRFYHVVALQVPITFNKEGDHDPNGMLYALQGARYPDGKEFDLKANIRALKRLAGQSPQLHPLVRPLVLRACVGERVEILFENQLSTLRAGIHLEHTGFNVQTSDGAAVGRNNDSTVPPKGRTTYIWDLPDGGDLPNGEGVYVFTDMANPSGEEVDGTNLHGLFGMLVVEPQGAEWRNPETGDRIADGLYADVIMPQAARSFREYAVFFHDEVEVHPGGESGHFQAMVQPERLGSSMRHTAHPLTPISYRSEPLNNRLAILERLKQQGKLRDVIGEEQHHSSWAFGDPATPVLRAYRGDPTKIRLVHAGVKETHVFHLHLHQWYAVPEVAASPTIDSISISPQTGVTIEPLFGAGSRQRAFGDVIWHCHLYPHFHEGMWGIWRIHDRLEDGSRTRRYPDGTRIPALHPLPGRVPPRPTADQPGFPLFIPGTYPQKSPQVPWVRDEPPPVGTSYRRPTRLERANFVADPSPGETFVEIGPRREPDRRFHVVGIPVDIIYNQAANWHDPSGHVFVLAEDEEAVRSGRKRPEPLFIRANRGEVVEFRFTNKFPTHFEGDRYDCEQDLSECGLHVHLVKFDPLVADGASVGWNYFSGARPRESLFYRWYVDEEFGSIFFHDHLFAVFRQRRGLFGAMLAEPEGTTFHDPGTDMEIRSGSRAVIKRGDQPLYREFCLAVADFIPMYQGGREINPPPECEDIGEDQGTMGVNYRCEPMHFRGNLAAFWFDSEAFDDPETPVFRTYPGDPIRLRLIQGSHEEQHSFVVHGMRWRQWWKDERSPLRNQQTIGISEAFNFIVDPVYGPGDHLWMFAAADDLWLGCWGLIRSHARRRAGLIPLEGLSQLDHPEHPAQSAPAGVRLRRFEIAAYSVPVLYNERLGHFDPHGLIYRLERHIDPDGRVVEEYDPLDVRNMTPRAYEPLILRCQVGDWIEVRLENRFHWTRWPTPESKPPELPVDRPRTASPRVSLHAHLLRYDVRRNDGSNVGFNIDLTIPPGYFVHQWWHADAAVGPVLLTDWADFRNHRHHGLIGALIVEPEKAEPDRWSGPTAEVRLPDGTRFRELVLLLQDGLRLYDRRLRPVPDPDDDDLDPEDQGQKAFNYRAEPIDRPTWMRLEHPETPLFTVRRDERLVLHLLLGADRARNHSFTVHDHLWPAEPHLGRQSPLIGSVGALSVATTRDLLLWREGSAAGDYAYRSGILRWMLSQGLWGIIRVE